MCSILAYCGKGTDKDGFKEALSKTISRGPDDQRIVELPDGGFFGFNRLEIMGLTPEGMQPFRLDNNYCICNGELYGFRAVKEELQAKGYVFRSDSDCEILLPLYKELGTGLFATLDAEFACVIYDGVCGGYVAARDPIGIRPLYYGYDIRSYRGVKPLSSEEMKTFPIVFASEPKNLIGVCAEVFPFPPGHYYKDGEFILYKDPSLVQTGSDEEDLDTICRGIRDKLLAGVEKRLDSDSPVGYLLSGGLDSSLICGAAARFYSEKPLETFSIGMDLDAIDLKYAREVADYIGSNHHEVIITRDDVIAALDPVIHALGTYDITTVRASVGMYLLCKWIHEHTDIRVILTGEISDELFGYKYTDFAPGADEFQKEAEKRIRELNVYDVLRADRCISVNALEARVPFGDLDFVDYVMAIKPEMKLNRYGIGKYLLRHAFEADELIPYDILMREKAAFSDAVGHSLRNDIIEFAESLYSDEEFEEKSAGFEHCPPFTKESLLFREIFEKHYPGQGRLIPAFWMPNKEWPGCDVNDPSARVLSNYGDSGI